MANEIEVMLSFDCTGSMYPCLTQVRRVVEETVRRLVREIPGIRIGVIAHGDYCDKNDTYVTKMLNLTDDVKKLCTFVRQVEATYGGDAPECYEYVLNQVRTLASWSSGKSKVLVLIGDDVPHGASEAQNFMHLDWRNEAGLLKEAGVKVFAVQALNRGHATSFYSGLARLTDGLHLRLNQFGQVVDLIMAVCYQQAGTDSLAAFENEIITNGRMNRDMDAVFNTLFGRTASSARFTTPASLEAVPPGRFQVLRVDTDCPIREFAENNGLTFKKGRGFYEFTKRVKVQDYKEVILMDNATGDLFSGEKAREIAGIPIGVTASVKPGEGALADYTCFIQSTSYNRKLLAGTRFLYEVEDWAA